MKHPIRKFVRDPTGASAVEFALVAPVFLLLLFGMIEFARLFWATHALHETAIATARCMGIPQIQCEDGGTYSSENAIAFAKSKAAGWLIQLDPTAITLDRNASCNGLPSLSKARIEYQFITVVPNLLMSLVGGTQLGAEACYTNY